MKRTFDAQMVVLPSLNASDAVLLGTKLRELIDEDRALPKAVLEAALRLGEAHAPLEEAWLARASNPAPNEALVMEVNRAFNAGWRGAHDFLKGWTQISKEKGGEKSALAIRTLAMIFPGGLGFLRLPRQKKLSEANRRLGLVVHHELERAFTELGGQLFLEELSEVQEKFAEVLGLTGSEDPSLELPSVQEPLRTFLTRLREYVVQVTAFGGSGRQRSKKRAAKLLAPLARWESTRAKASVPTAQPAPVPAPAPASVTPPNT